MDDLWHSHTEKGRPRHAHFIGIGGTGMRSLAGVLRERGWTVTGSDLSLGGHNAKHVPPMTELVVYSLAVNDENCELNAARDLGIGCLSYPQALGALTRGRCTLAVAGTHGKSTVTAMCGAILSTAGLEPTVVCGAAPRVPTGNRPAGSGQPIVVEACEYRCSFLNLAPTFSAILNLEHDHFDCFADVRQVHQAFRAFAERTQRRGVLLLPADGKLAKDIAAEADCRRETFGVDCDADWIASDFRSEGGRYSFSLLRNRRRLARIGLPVRGRHNMKNAVAAAALSFHAGADAAAIRHALQQFPGLRRRLEFRGCFQGVRWVDDYAHHPTEVRAGLSTLREMAPGARVWCVFEPHQRSRMAALLADFAECLTATDRVLVAPVFHAREAADGEPRDCAEELAARIRALSGRAECVPNFDGIEIRLRQAIGQAELTRGDIIVTMGAGNIGKLGDGIGLPIRTHRAA